MSNLLYKISHALLRSYAAIMLRMEIRKLADMPDGPKLFVANHPSATDPFLIHLVARDPMSVLISANAFAVPVFGGFLHRMRQIPVNKQDGGAALEQAEHVLRSGRSVAIFPEGDFSPQEGGMRPPRSGAARLALRTGVPIIPVGISLDERRRMTIRSRMSGHPTVGYWYLRGPYHLTVGQAFHVTGDAQDKEHVRSISERIMDVIRALAAESERRRRLTVPAQ